MNRRELEREILRLSTVEARAERRRARAARQVREARRARLALEAVGTRKDRPTRKQGGKVREVNSHGGTITHGGKGRKAATRGKGGAE